LCETVLLHEGVIVGNGACLTEGDFMKFFNIKIFLIIVCVILAIVLICSGLSGDKKVSKTVSAINSIQAVDSKDSGVNSVDSHDEEHAVTDSMETSTSSASSVSSSNPVSPNMNYVMSLSNFAISWSHQYPSSFICEHNGYWNVPSNNLFLTFDCGYDYKNLASTIMDVLKAKNVKAVFFVTGDFMKSRPDLVLRMLAEGHIVGNHSYAHLNQPQNLNISTTIVVNDIKAWENTYVNIVGSKPSILYFRPPEGAVSERSLELMNELGYKTLMWGCAYEDYDTSAQPSASSAMNSLRKYTTPGDVILLHGISQTSTDVLGQYIDEYRSRGFEFKLF
jgi:peptidoglycan-N-acetylmuramic acid deacetylase